MTATKPKATKKPRAAGARARKPAIFEKSQPPEGAPAPHATASPAQTVVGLLLFTAGAVGMAGFGFWLTGDIATDQAYWIARAGAHAVAAALVAWFLWTLVRRAGISYILLLGFLVAGTTLYNGAQFWQLKRQSAAATTIIDSLAESGRDLGDLTEKERRNPYIDAYLVMYDLYWQLDQRADSRLAAYSTAYAKYTRRSAFLDTSRLKTRTSLWRSAAQLYDLDRQLLLVRHTPVDISGRLGPLNSVPIDRATRNAYRKEFLAKQAAINRAQADSIENQRRVIARTLNSIETLLEPRGGYRFKDGDIVFENPVDAARFAGKNIR